MMVTIFSMTIISNLQSDAILEDVDPSQTHISQIQAGEHETSIILTDSDGMQRIETINLVVMPSPPDVIIVKPRGAIVFGWRRDTRRRIDRCRF